MQFMFSADPMASNRVEKYFEPQAANLTAFGKPAIFSIEDGEVRCVRSGERIVYRGWMLNSSEYDRMNVLVEQNSGQLLTSLRQYLNTHHIPSWYPILREFTPETFFIDNKWLNDGCDIVAELKNLGWSRFFLKDFVKSLKTAGGSIVKTPEDAPRVVELMEKYRGTIEGGLSIRKFEDLHDERRYFIVNKHVWSPILREIDHPMVDTRSTGNLAEMFLFIPPTHQPSVFQRASAPQSITISRWAFCFTSCKPTCLSAVPSSGGRPLASDKSAFVGAVSSLKLSQLNVAFIPVVLDFPVSPCCDLFSDTMSLAHRHEAKLLSFQHFGEGAFTSSDCQSLRPIIPAESDDRMLPTLVRISIARIFIEIKLTIRSWVDTKLNIARWILVSEFDLRP